MTNSTIQRSTATKPAPAPERSVRDLVFQVERFGLVGVFLLLVLAFSVMVPDTFPTSANWSSIAVSQAVTGVIAFALIVPLLAGRFDISVGSNVGLTMIVAALVMVDADQPLPVAVLAAVATGTIVGAFNGIVVAYLGVNSLVATLGSSTIIAGLVQLITGGVPVVEGMSETLVELGSDTVVGVPTLFAIMLLIAAGVWYAHTQTVWGRNLVAVGSNADAARLVGVNVRRAVLSSFMASGALCGVGGVLAIASLGSADPSVGGITMILPALAAAFLGATAFTPGQYNVPGTLVGIFFVAATVSGLALLGTQVWVEAVFQGSVVILAVAVSQYVRWRRTGELQIGA